MTTHTTALPATKSAKHGGQVRFTPTGGDDGPHAGCLVIDLGRTVTAYLVTEFPTGFPGRGFHLSKLTEGSDAECDSYDVFCGQNGQDRSCDCKGFTRWNHCRHEVSVRVCIGNGWL